GKDSLQGTVDDNISDRIEAGTFLVAAAVTGSNITIRNVRSEHLAVLITKLEDTGASIQSGNGSVSITAPDRPDPVSITTAIYPGFPTDMQAQWIALMCLASGTSTGTDTIYHDRFSHVPELQRLCARISLGENTAVVNGVERLTGAKVMSTDLRASASLILAGLAARGTTEVLRVYHIDRGYESIEKKLQALGADIVRVSGKEY
ncbi:MAG: UDP-N-acetylglucosamine 1-carboxyvinyltransferase, partial [Chlorobi bacterium]|nr:UDP-N-acetylglucosamine 1-carboxyvinyltransferase [Chlorobiota bacterium]